MFDFEKLSVYNKAKEFNEMMMAEVLSKNNLNKI